VKPATRAGENLGEARGHHGAPCRAGRRRAEGRDTHSRIGRAIRDACPWFPSSSLLVRSSSLLVNAPACPESSSCSRGRAHSRILSGFVLPTRLDWHRHWWAGKQDR